MKTKITKVFGNKPASQNEELREPYWEFMGRKLREERGHNSYFNSEYIMKKEIQEMQSLVHILQMRIIELNDEVHHLNDKVQKLGGLTTQLELDI
jgi:hypothetical protein